MSHIVEIRDRETFAQYQLVWNSLFLQTPEASFFQTWDWLDSYWEHFGRDQQFRVLVVYAGDKPLGILPLCVRREVYKVGGLRVLTYPLHDWGAFYGPIGPSPTATLLAGLRHIRETERDWDLIDLRWTNREGWDRGRTGRAMQQVGWTAYHDRWAELACVDTSGTWDAYFASRSGKFRSNVRRCQRLLARAGKVEHLHWRPQGALVGDGDPRWDLYDACETVAARSWQGSSNDGTTLTHESVRPFLRDTHQHAARRGMVDLHLILVDEQPAAFAYNYHYEGRVEGLRSGYDPVFSACGIGHVLYRYALNQSFLCGDTHYNLGASYLRAKRHWLTHLEQNYRYTYFPARVLRAQALRAKRVLTQWWPGRNPGEGATAPQEKNRVG